MGTRTYNFPLPDYIISEAIENKADIVELQLSADRLLKKPIKIFIKLTDCIIFDISKDWS